MIRLRAPLDRPGGRGEHAPPAPGPCLGPLGGREEHRQDGRLEPRVDPAVREDQEVRAVLDRGDGPVEDRLQRRSIPAAPSAAGKSIGRIGRLEPAPAVELLELGELVVVDDRHVQRDLAAALRRRHQQVALAPGAGEDGGHQLLADRVERRVGDLGEELLEVVEQRLGAVGEDGQRGVGPHRADRLLAVVAHRAEDVLEVFERVAERLLAVEQGVVVGCSGRGPAAGHLGQRDHVLAEPLAVGLRGGDPVLQLLVVDDPALLQVDQEHLARLEPALAGRRPRGGCRGTPTSEAMTTRPSLVTT